MVALRYSRRMGFRGKLNEQANSLNGGQILKQTDGLLSDFEARSSVVLAPC